MIRWDKLLVALLKVVQDDARLLLQRLIEAFYRTQTAFACHR